MSTYPARPQAAVPIYWVLAPYFVKPSPSSSHPSLSPAWPPSSPSSTTSTTPSPGARPSALFPPAAPRPRTIPLPADPQRVAPPSNHPTAPAAHKPKTSANAADAARPIVDLPSIDPLISFSPSPGALPPLTWDLARDPTPILAMYSSSLRRRPAVRASASATASALATFTIVFPLLPYVQVTVRPTYPRPFVSPADVLAALHRGLREPVDAAVFEVLEESDRARLRQNARARCAASGRAADMVVKIDFLAKRRKFLGLRPAQPSEVPSGRRLGEVFVVEVGLIEE